MALRWRIPFTSRKGYYCHIDIYDPSYTGQTVIELSTTNPDAPAVPAPDPFYFEEDDDQDLLKVVRIKTGYINLVETQFDGLTDIYATSLKSRYVEVFYNSTIVFRGYLQQQTFENDWRPAPREVSLPVISVLGLTESLSFDAELPLTDKSLGYYMKQLLRKVEPTDNTAAITRYNRVLFSGNAAGDITATIHPTVVTVDNPDFSKAKLSSTQPYKGIKLYDLLEGICNAYGWIAHDMPTCILFTKFDNSSIYYYYPVDYSSTNDIETLSGRAVTQIPETDATLQLGNLMEPSADDSTITQIMPYRTVNAKYDGELVNSVDINLEHMRCNRLFEATRAADQTKYAVAILENVTGSPEDIHSQFLKPQAGISGGKFDVDGVVAINMNNQKHVMLQNSAAWQGGDYAFALNFFKRPMNDEGVGVAGKLKMDVEVSWGEYLYDLGHNTMYPYQPIQVQFNLYSNNVYVGAKMLEFYNDENYKQTVEFDENVTNLGAVTMVVKILNPEAQRSLIFSFDKIRLYYDAGVGNEYLFETTDHENIGIGDGSDDVDVDMLINCRRIGSNMLGSSTHAFVTYYNYLRQPQTRLQLRMMQYSGDIINAPFAYINKIIYWQANWRWRLIALAFHPRDDEYTLTMHRSPVLQ